MSKINWLIFSQWYYVINKINGKNSTNTIETKERMAMTTEKTRRIKVKKLLASSLRPRTREEERKAERHQVSNINLYT